MTLVHGNWHRFSFEFWTIPCQNQRDPFPIQVAEYPYLCHGSGVLGKKREITRWFWGKFFYLACRKLDMFSDIFPGLKYQDNWGFRPAVQGNVLKTQQLIWGFAVFFVWKVCKAALSKGLTRCFGNRWWCFVSRGHSWHQINAELDATQIFICGRTTSWIYGHGFTRGWPSREWIHASSDILMDFISWRLFKYAIWIFAGELDPNIDKSDLKCILYYILEKD